MSESKHTAGEWSVTNDAWDRGWSVDSDGDNSMVAVTAEGRRDPICLVVEGSAFGRDDRLDANARLIAASPDLLGVAKALDASWTESFPEGPEEPRTDLGIRMGDEHIALWRQCRAAIQKATA